MRSRCKTDLFKDSFSGLFPNTNLYLHSPPPKSPSSRSQSRRFPPLPSTPHSRSLHLSPTDLHYLSFPSLSYSSKPAQLDTKYVPVLFKASLPQKKTQSLSNPSPHTLSIVFSFSPHAILKIPHMSTSLCPPLCAP